MRSAAIETPRLLLRPLERDDLDALAAMYRDPETMRYVGEGVVLDREQTAASLERHRSLALEQGYGLWATELKADGSVIGRCGLVDWDDIDGRAELEVAYLIARERWGQGFASEAAAACRDHAFDVLDASRLVAFIRHANVASQAVARHIGLEHERDVTLLGQPCMLFSLEP